MSKEPAGLIEQILEKLKENGRAMQDIALDNRLRQEWYTDTDCARLKGISKASLSEHKWMQPKGGKDKKLINGRMRHHRSAVKEWLLQDDAQLLLLYASPEEKETFRASRGRNPLRLHESRAS